MKFCIDNMWIIKRQGWILPKCHNATVPQYSTISEGRELFGCMRKIIDSTSLKVGARRVVVCVGAALLSPNNKSERPC